jgi:hypothetical protein
MPLTPIDYQKGIIYKIQHLENEELLYVGSTTNFIKRKQHHKERCNTPTNSKYNLKIYKMMRDNGGWDQFKMIIIKEFPCNNKTELLIEEDRLMIELKSNMNKLRAHMTEDRKKEHYRLKASDYRLNNKEKVKEYKKERGKIKFNCECGSDICIEHKARHLNTLKHKEFILINTK